MKTLFGKTFLGIAAALLLLSAVLGIAFYLGLQRSVTSWNINRTRHLQQTFAHQVLRVSRQEGELRTETLSGAFERFLTPGVSVVVLTDAQNPVFIYDDGSPMDPTDSEQVQPLLNSLGQDRSPALAVFDEERIVAYVSVDSLGFRSDLTNRQFLNSILVSIGTALALSFALALAVALLISRRLTSQARQLAIGLTDLSRGSRDVVFPRTGAEELQAIADAAGALQEQLSRGERLRRQWMQDIAHDLRTPVAALGSQLEAMTEGVLDPTPERLTAVAQELHQVEALVRDLRELNWVESPERPLEYRTVRFDHLLETAVERLRHRNDARQISWNIQVVPAEVDADESLLLRSITNILDNAVVHGPETQTISITLQNDSDVFRLSCTNTGSVREEDRPYLFDRLYRGDRGRSTRGSGLGLAITRAIIERHQGDISIESGNNLVTVSLTIPHQKTT